MYTLQCYTGNQVVILIMMISLIQRFIMERFHFNIFSNTKYFKIIYVMYAC